MDQFGKKENKADGASITPPKMPPSIPPRPPRSPLSRDSKTLSPKSTRRVPPPIPFEDVDSVPSLSRLRSRVAPAPPTPEAIPQFHRSPTSVRKRPPPPTPRQLSAPPSSLKNASLADTPTACERMSANLPITPKRRPVPPPASPARPHVRNISNIGSPTSDIKRPPPPPTPASPNAPVLTTSSPYSSSQYSVSSISNNAPPVPPPIRLKTAGESKRRPKPPPIPSTPSPRRNRISPRRNKNISIGVLQIGSRQPTNNNGRDKYDLQTLPAGYFSPQHKVTLRYDSSLHSTPNIVSSNFGFQPPAPPVSRAVSPLTSRKNSSKSLASPKSPSPRPVVPPRPAMPITRPKPPAIPDRSNSPSRMRALAVKEAAPPKPRTHVNPKPPMRPLTRYSPSPTPSTESSKKFPTSAISDRLPKSRSTPSRPRSIDSLPSDDSPLIKAKTVVTPTSMMDFAKISVRQTAKSYPEKPSLPPPPPPKDKRSPRTVHLDDEESEEHRVSWAPVPVPFDRAKSDYRLITIENDQDDGDDGEHPSPPPRPRRASHAHRVKRNHPLPPRRGARMPPPKPRPKLRPKMSKNSPRNKTSTSPPRHSKNSHSTTSLEMKSKNKYPVVPPRMCESPRPRPRPNSNAISPSARVVELAPPFKEARKFDMKFSQPHTPVTSPASSLSSPLGVKSLVMPTVKKNDIVSPISEKSHSRHKRGVPIDSTSPSISIESVTSPKKRIKKKKRKKKPLFLRSKSGLSRSPSSSKNSDSMYLLGTLTLPKLRVGSQENSTNPQSARSTTRSKTLRPGDMSRAPGLMVISPGARIGNRTAAILSRLRGVSAQQVKPWKLSRALSEGNNIGKSRSAASPDASPSASPIMRPLRSGICRNDDFSPSFNSTGTTIRKESPASFDSTGTTIRKETPKTTPRLRPRPVKPKKKVRTRSPSPGILDRMRAFSRSESPEPIREPAAGYRARVQSLASTHNRTMTPPPRPGRTNTLSVEEFLPPAPRNSRRQSFADEHTYRNASNSIEPPRAPRGGGKASLRTLKGRMPRAISSPFGRKPYTILEKGDEMTKSMVNMPVGLADGLDISIQKPKSKGKQSRDKLLQGNHSLMVFEEEGNLVRANDIPASVAAAKAMGLTESPHSIVPKRRSIIVGGRSRLSLDTRTSRVPSDLVQRSLSLHRPNTPVISFIVKYESKAGRKKAQLTSSVCYCDWKGRARFMQCRFKQALIPVKRIQGETLFEVKNLIDKNGLDDVQEEWQYLDWDEKKCLAQYDGKRFKTHMLGETKAQKMDEIRFLSHNREKCRLVQTAHSLNLEQAFKHTNTLKKDIQTNSQNVKLPRYTFRETAMQIEKDRAIFARMGVDSTQLALDGLLKAEYTHKVNKTTKSPSIDVTEKVKSLAPSGTLYFQKGSDLSQIFNFGEDISWRDEEKEEFLYIQYRVAGEPKEIEIPRRPTTEVKVFVGLTKLVPVVRLTCADLVDRLIQIPSSLFLRTFLLTLPYHTSSDYVLRLLLKRTYPAVDSKWRPRIFSTIKKWVQMYPEDYHDTELLGKLLNYAKDHSELTQKEINIHDRESIRLLKVLKTSLESYRDGLAMKVRFALWPSFQKDAPLSDSFSKKLNSYDERKVALEMTLLAQKRLQSLSGRDFIKKGYAETSRNQMVISEHMAKWVGTTVLIEQDTKACVTAVNRWLRIARDCLDMNNFNTLFEITAGISQTPVMRIVKNQEGLDERLLTDLKHITSMNGNYKVYRGSLARERGRPCVPYFGVLLRDMLCYEEAKPKIKSTFEDGTVWVNVKKCMRMGSLVADALLFRGNRYVHKSSQSILDLIESSMRCARNEDTLYEMSYSIKPRGTK